MSSHFITSPSPPPSPSSHLHPLSNPSQISPSLFFQWRPKPSQHHPLKLTPKQVSLQDPPPQNTPKSQEPNDPHEKTQSSFKNSIWINPRSPNASRLLSRSSDSRYASLSHLAASLDAQTDVSGVLASLGDNPSEQDLILVVNNMANTEAAVNVLRWCQENLELQREVILYNVTLKVLRKCKDWVKVESLLNDMISRSVRPDNVTFSTVISCARQCNLPEKAIEWFERMPEFGLDSDDITYSAMIDAYGRSGKVDMALGLYDRARKERWRLDPVTFSTLIRIYGMSGNFDGALNVYEEMKALGVKPNLVIYNTLMDAMGRAGRPWHVKTIYREMSNNGFSPNWGTYAALIRTYGRARYAEDALSVYREMVQKGLELNVVLYNTLLAMCADLGYVDQALEIFAQMKGSDKVKPDSWTYSSLITIYSCSGEVSEAEGVLKQMVEAGFQPNIFVLTSLIQCYGKASRTNDVVRTFEWLLELGITPDDRFCGCLLNVLTQTPKEDLAKVIQCIERSNSMVGTLARRLSEGDTFEGMFKQEADDLFKNVSREVKKAYCNCLIDLCVNLDQLERACQLLELGLELKIYTGIQSKSSTRWSLNLRSLSLGAALTALHVWMNDLSKAVENGEELPPLLGINTGHGKHKYTEKGLSSVFESHLKEMDAPFHGAPDQPGWFLTTKVAAKLWLESRSPPNLVAA
ncbi:Pentatricopeptide repeat-containing protein [Acorus gramineus]|uniref:Pentatricopeptide repeat-containing protein n=1 Tax=Acorus gramineus TaxID=55184 RepID=A0AAV9AVJ8_ACOGR|nr:Pentatricopeptide repeat-containing protein [Acorus gramineus]